MSPRSALRSQAQQFNDLAVGPFAKNGSAYVAHTDLAPPPPPLKPSDYLNVPSVEPRTRFDGAEHPNIDQNGSAVTATTIAATGNQLIDGVLAGVRWAGGTISYADTDAATDYQPGYLTDQNNNSVSAQNEAYSQFTAQQMTALHTVMNTQLYTQQPGAAGFSVEGFTNLNVDYAGAGSGAATIRAANSGDAATAYAAYPGNYIQAGDTFFGNTYDATIFSMKTPVAGGYAWFTMYHEIGHSLGLKHGHETNVYGALPANRNSMEFSLMTYATYIGQPTPGPTAFEQWGAPQTFMMADIRALQEMYGADFTINGGNTTYKWNPGSGQTLVDGQVAIAPGGTRIFATIWDGNGVDTYDLSSYTTSLTLDLQPEGYSVFSSAQLANLGGGPNGGFARGNIFNAMQYNGDPRSLIENAIGGSAADQITGNAANNLLDGRQGNDTLIGLTGNDTYRVDSAGDVVTEALNQGTDTVLTTVSYVLAANQSIETLQLDASTVAQPLNLTGNNIGNVLIGNAGANVLNGGAGADLMQGGSGNDSYVVDNAGDVVKENGGSGSGVDTVVSLVSYALTAGQYVEVLQFGSAVGAAALNLTGNELANSIIGNAGANALQGLAGADVLQGGGARDILVPGVDTQADTIRFNAIADSTGGNRDQLLSADFNNEDKLDFAIRPTVFLGTVVVGALNNGANFNIEIGNAVNGLLNAGGAVEAVLFDPNAGGLNQAGHSYLVVDANNDGSYTANNDYLVELVNFVGTLDATDFI